jgi:CheY-like chemotaxis protein
MTRAALLLVDDDEMSSQILGYILTDEGYEADTVTTGATAVEKFTEKKYDLVLLDYILPDMKGLEVAKMLKSIKPEARIILLTGYMNNDEAGHNLYDRVLLKPIPPDIIIRTIAEVLPDRVL